MKIKELMEDRTERRHPSTFGFDQVMDLYNNIESFYEIDNPTEDMIRSVDELKRIYAMTDPEVRRDVELTHRSKDPDMGQPDRF